MPASFSNINNDRFGAFMSNYNVIVPTNIAVRAEKFAQDPGLEECLELFYEGEALTRKGSTSFPRDMEMSNQGKAKCAQAKEKFIARLQELEKNSKSSDVEDKKEAPLIEVTEKVELKTEMPPPQPPPLEKKEVVTPAAPVYEAKTIPEVNTPDKTAKYALRISIMSGLLALVAMVISFFNYTMSLSLQKSIDKQNALAEEQLNVLKKQNQIAEDSLNFSKEQAKPKPTETPPQ
jgi:hypothetical protein